MHTPTYRPWPARAIWPFLRFSPALNLRGHSRTAAFKWCKSVVGGWAALICVMSSNIHSRATSGSKQDHKTYPVAWVNKFGKARVFGTTLGHSDDTWRDPVFLQYVSQGLLWAAGR